MRETTFFFHPYMLTFYNPPISFWDVISWTEDKERLSTTIIVETMLLAVLKKMQRYRKIVVMLVGEFFLTDTEDQILCCIFSDLMFPTLSPQFSSWMILQLREFSYVWSNWLLHLKHFSFVLQVHSFIPVWILKYLFKCYQCKASHLCSFLCEVSSFHTFYTLFLIFCRKSVFSLVKVPKCLLNSAICQNPFPLM